VCVVYVLCVCDMCVAVYIFMCMFVNSFEILFMPFLSLSLEKTSRQTTAKQQNKKQKQRKQKGNTHTHTHTHTNLQNSENIIYKQKKSPKMSKRSMT